MNEKAAFYKSVLGIAKCFDVKPSLCMQHKNLLKSNSLMYLTKKHLGLAG